LGRGGGVPAGAGGEATSHLRFRLIGTFAVWRDGQRIEDRDVGSRKGRTLLKALLLSADEAVTRDHLLAILWPDADPSRAARNLASLISRLRSFLGTDAIDGGGGTYRLRTGPGLEVDLREAERLASQARTDASAGAPSLAWTAVVRALGLVGDRDLLEGDPDSGWADDARVALEVFRHDLRRQGWEAALALSDGEGARGLAEAALRADPLDEEACRAVMHASQLRGEIADGLLAYDALRETLADELGVAPSGRTQELHLALLREEPVEGGATGPDPVPTTSTDGASFRSPIATTLVGRDRELRRLHERWAAATEGRSGLVVIAGEAGIGKTRLAEEVASAACDVGGIAMVARCYEAERSLFLGPLVEVLASLARTTAPGRFREAAHPWEGTLAELVPEAAPVLGTSGYEPAAPRIERRRTFEAISSSLRALSRHQPLLILLDDLHNAGSSTIELLHYLLRHVTGGRLLVVATIRIEEGAAALYDLADVAERVELGPLPDEAVTALADRAGASDVAERILASTRGHTLSVVETLQAITEADADLDEPPVPESLKVAVLQRLQRAGPEVEELLRGAAILGSTFEPATVADLLDLGIEDVLRRAGQGVGARLLVEDGAALAFSNDLIREIVYQTTPQPVRVARHRRAATLLEGQPEVVATHASAAGEWPRALEAWLAAAEQATDRYANRDAEELLQRAIDAGEAAGDPAGVARARLARGNVREALATYPEALEDLEAAAELARSSARPDLEAAALCALGGDVIVGLGRPSTDCLPYLEAGLHVAQSAQLGQLEVDLLGRLAVVWTNRTRFDLASRDADRALDRARELDDPRAVALALDAVKNVSAYMGDIRRLETVLPELERLLRDSGDLALLQWAVFESVIPPLARAQWDASAAVLDRALALNRRTGYSWGALFIAHRSWMHRARGNYGAAVDDARTAGRTDTAAGHPWWVSFANAMLGWVLSDLGAQEAAIGCLERGVASAERDGMETYLVRCVGHLALAHWRHGDRSAAAEHLVRAERLLDGVTTPEGRAFLHGAHAVAAVARVRVERGDLDRAEDLLEPLRVPAEAAGWCEVMATDRLLRGRCRVMSDDLEAARSSLDEAASIADRAGLVPLAHEAHAELAGVAELLGDGDAASWYRRVATAHRDTIAASIVEPDLRARYLGV